MQVFEFHFNPKEKNDWVFDSFCYEPENIYEKRMGNLYMLGSLKQALPQNRRFLENLAKTIKDKFYKTLSVPVEKSLKESLRKANESLEKIAKEGDVSWLGNLTFTVISIKDLELNFTKVGDLKVFLIRKGQLIDIDQKVRFDEIEPYPLKIFGNIVCGKLVEDDTVLVLSKEVFTCFSQENILAEIANMSLFDSKKLKQIFNNKKEKLLKISGICLIMVLTKETSAKKEEILAQPKTLKIFSLKKVFSPFVKVFKLPKISFKKPVISIPRPKFKLFKPKIAKTPKPKTPKLKLPQLSFVKIKTFFFDKFVKFKIFFFAKKINVILILILILAIGLFFLGKKEEKQLEDYQAQLNQIQEKVNQAESYLVVAESNPNAKDNANVLYKESLEEIFSLINISSGISPAFTDQLSTLKNDISKNLYQLNKLTEISEPELIFEFDLGKYVPQKLISHSENLYFFSSYSKNAFEVNQKKRRQNPAH